MSESGRRSAAAPEQPSSSLRFLYRTAPGRALLAVLSCRFVSSVAGAALSLPVSRLFVPRFAKKNGIDLSEYEDRRYRSFNDFFTRRVKPENRPVDPAPDALVSPCDARLSVYPVREDSLFRIKNSEYSVASLLGEDGSAFAGGLCLVFRLCVDNYHRFCFFDGGMKTRSRFIRGKLHTVRPIATDSGVDIFARNCRTVSYLESEGFGRAAFCCIGALLVGKIVLSHPGPGRVSRGEEAGFFRFGGSTVVLLLPAGSARLDGDIIKASEEGKEISVRFGERIGRSLKDVSL